MPKIVRFLLIFGVFWSAITLAFDAKCVHSLFNQARSLGFRSIQGRVLESEITEHHNDGTTYGAKIRYQYTIDGRTYESDRVCFGQMKASDGKWARATVAAFPAGATCTVYYDRTDHSSAVLQTGIDGQTLFLAMFLTPFNAVMISLWGTLFLAWRPPPPAGGARIATLADRVEVRFVDFTPTAWALTAISGVAFVLIFVVGFGGFYVALPVMLTAWSIILAAGLWAFFSSRRRLTSAPADLIIDAARGTLTLVRPAGSPGQPATWKSWRRASEPAESRVLPLERIRGIERHERTTSSADGNSHEYIVVALAAPADPAAAVEKHDLGSWILGNRAEAFAAWLRGMLGLQQS